MAAGKLLSRAFSFLPPQSSPLPHLRRLSIAAAAAADLNHSPENTVSVLHFLRGRGLADEALAGFSPHLLDSKVGKDLPAKFDLLLTRGLSVSDAAKVLRHHELLHHISLNVLQQRLDALRTIVPDDANLRRIINRSAWTLSGPEKIRRMAGLVSKLRGWGVSDSKIKTLLVSNPRFFQMKPQGLDDAADRAEVEFGFRRDSKMFIDAVIVLWKTNESTRESKFRVLERFGWDRSGVMVMLRIQPTFIYVAEATLVKKLDFLLKEVGYEPSYITKRPAMLSLSLERRLRPRFELFNALKSNNLLPKGYAFYTVLCISEANFMDKFVFKFMKEEPTICNAYINTVVSPKKLASGFVDQSLSLSKA